MVSWGYSPQWLPTHCQGVPHPTGLGNPQGNQWVLVLSLKLNWGSAIKSTTNNHENRNSFTHPYVKRFSRELK